MSKTKQAIRKKIRQNPAYETGPGADQGLKKETRQAIYFAGIVSIIITALTLLQIDNTYLIPTTFLRYLTYSLTMFFPVVAITLFGLITGVGIMSDFGFIAASVLLHFPVLFILSRAYFRKAAAERKKYGLMLLAGLILYLTAAMLYL